MTALTSRQIVEARELLGWSRADLARDALLPLALVEVVEEYGSTFMLSPGQGIAIRHACERAGIDFSEDSVTRRKVRP